MNPGPELDALVAEHVMGWTDLGPRWSDNNLSGYRWQKPTGERLAAEHFQPSTEITAAWPLVEKLGLWVFPHEDVWIAGRPRSLSGKEYDPDMYMDEHGIVDGRLDMVTAATAPLAICLAALKVSGAALPAGEG